MKLVIATPLYPPEPGGPASYCKILEDELPKLGWDVEVVKFSDVRHLPKFVRHVAYGLRVFGAARGANAILALDPVSVGLPASLAAKYARRPFFVKVVGDYAWEQGVQRFGITDTLDAFMGRKVFPPAVARLRRIESRVARRARKIIVPSLYLQKVVESWGIPESSITVIYNSPPLPLNYAKGENPIEGMYIVTVGRLVPWKGMGGVIRALGEIHAQLPDMRLVVVGDGPERGALQKIAQEAGLKDAVVFVGNQPHEETLAYMAHAQAFILNTQYEGMSHAILEAFALRVPVLTTSAGGNKELVEDGVTGLVFPIDDAGAIAQAVIRIMGNEELRSFITRHARVQLEDFTQEKMLAQLSRVLDTLSV